MTILIYDWDFCHYQHVPPNLECAKLAAYFKEKKHITVFKDKFEPEHYTQSYFRKDYEDGIYDKKILKDNVFYGGRAFSDKYIQFSKEIEHIKPDFTIYEKYMNYFSNKKDDIDSFKTCLNATHLRLTLDDKKIEPFPFERLDKRHKSIFFHDYNLECYPEIADILKDICNYELGMKTYRFGNKFPINVYNYSDLKKWLSMPAIDNFFFIQYNGIFSDEEIIDLVHNYAYHLKQIIYNFSYNYNSQYDFLSDGIIEVFRHILFLRRNKRKMLLNIDTDFFKDTNLLNLLYLFNAFLNNKLTNYNRFNEGTLFGYCHNRTSEEYCFKRKRIIVTKEDVINSFQYTRERNYELFKLFYEVPAVCDIGGKLVNELHL